MGGVCWSAAAPQLTPEEVEEHKKRQEKALQAKREAEASNLIDKGLKADKKEDDREIKLLLLGPGEAGKSTILKQLRILHGDGFKNQSQVEERQWVRVVHGNITEGFKFIVQNTEDFADPALSAAVDAVDAWPTREAATMTPEMAALAVSFWKDAGVQAAWTARSKFPAILESLDYFMAHIDRIARHGYAATKEDILHTRVRTTGAVTERFVIDRVPVMVVDVGGQRSERQKWIPCFSNTTAVLFLVALSEYDQHLFEEHSVRRMDEALAVFDKWCNSEHLREAAIILFLNKSDLFADKLRRVPFRVDKGPQARFTDYKGPAFDFSGAQEVPQIGSPEFDHVHDAALMYLRKKFMRKNRVPGKEIYYRVTCAMDTENVQAVLSAVNDVILRRTIVQDLG